MRLRQWMEDEDMSSPTEYGANTPEYIYKMWGGEVPLNEIREAIKELKMGEKWLRKGHRGLGCQSRTLLRTWPQRSPVYPGEPDGRVGQAGSQCLLDTLETSRS